MPARLVKHQEGRYRAEQTMAKPSNFHEELDELLKTHNAMSANGRKAVARRTRDQRRRCIEACFRTLRRLGIGIGPRALRTTHIRTLIGVWTGDLAYRDLCRARGLVTRPCSADTIRQNLSFLRTFCNWIGKPGMIGPTAMLVPNLDEKAATPAIPASRENDAGGLTVDTALSLVRKLDHYVGVQLALVLAFQLQRSEAIMFCPELAVVPPDALPLQPGVDAYLKFVLRTRRPGVIRIRFTAIQNEFQRNAWDAACALAIDGRVAHPDLSFAQSRDLYSNILRKAGVTLAMLGARTHSLRRQFTADVYVDLAGASLPRPGQPLADEFLQTAYRQAAEHLNRQRWRTCAQPAPEGSIQQGWQCVPRNCSSGPA